MDVTRIRHERMGARKQGHKKFIQMGFEIPLSLFMDTVSRLYELCKSDNRMVMVRLALSTSLILTVTASPKR